MDIRKIRDEMKMGRSIYDLPLRVTFYARVSTAMDKQLNSLDNQVQHYTELIQSKPNWIFVPGYIDEGISGGTADKREAFLRMMEDAKAGCFDYIITKEISRFSRSTLDSIQYTQLLLSSNVGVFFENDGINTLDSDSEFRLVVMAAVAQDEIRKLSERLRFGFRQAIKNGHVLGNDRLYGYNKQKGIMTVNEEEAEIVRIVFDLYANHGLGTRKISQRLLEMGYTSREGNAFNTLTIRHMLENPKYKGWYCGQKTQNINYRTKEKVFLDENEWIMYPDPQIPAIVSEALWDRANALYKKRSTQMKEHANGATYHNRYAYSGKIYCEEHGTTYHRQVLESKKGNQEVWQCKVYRAKGRAGCSAPQLRSAELDLIMARIFAEMLQDKETIIHAVLTVLRSVAQEADYSKSVQRLESEIGRVNAKKERLLDLSLDGSVSNAEFKNRNDGLNDQLRGLKAQLASIRMEEEKQKAKAIDMDRIRWALDRELSFTEGVNSDLVAAILERITVKKESTKHEIHLDIELKLGHRFEAVYNPEKFSSCINTQKNTMPRVQTRRI